MSVEYKKDSNGKCPVMHGGVTKAGESNTSRLWPNSINLDILHQHDTKTNLDLLTISGSNLLSI